MLWIRILLTLACGVIVSAASPEVGAWPLVIAVVPFFALVASSERARGAFWLGFSFGIGFFALHLLWLPTSFSDLFGAVSWIIYPPLILALGCFWGLVTWLSHLLGKRGQGTLWLLPALWVLMEWLRSLGTFAFPWGFLGYIWVGTPLAQLADLAGVYGLSFLTALLASLLASLFVAPEGDLAGRLARASFPISIALLLVTLSLAYSASRLTEVLPQEERRALLVQGDTDPLGRAMGTEHDLDVYVRLTETAIETLEESPDLVIWPEGATIGGEVEGPEGQADRERIQASAGDTAVVAGSSIFENDRSFNRVFSLSDNEIQGRYDKVYLVPFGESVPFSNVLQPVYDVVYGWFGFARFFGRTPGESITPLSTPEADVAAYICYESVFPQVSRQMVAEGAEVLINISNDAWFGRGGGARQHFLMGSLRAIETRRYLLRVGNDGITGVVDPLGRVREELPRGGERTMLASYQNLQEESFYVRFGDWLIALLILYALGVSVAQLLRGESSGS